ncbi:MAG: hypothetical protein PW845_01745 [Pseudomonas sp.]|nr:hypothetical protein [Pseudomonas sp.]
MEAHSSSYSEFFSAFDAVIIELFRQASLPETIKSAPRVAALPEVD